MASVSGCVLMKVTPNKSLQPTRAAAERRTGTIRERRLSADVMRLSLSWESTYYYNCEGEGGYQTS